MASVNGTVYTIQCPSEDILLLGGRFWNINGVSVHNFAVLKKDATYGNGSEDAGKFRPVWSSWRLIAAPVFHGSNTTQTESMTPASEASDNAGAMQESMVLTTVLATGSFVTPGEKLGSNALLTSSLNLSLNIVEKVRSGSTRVACSVT